MLASLVLFAASDAKAEFDARARNVFRLDATDALLVLGVLVVLAALLFFWALYVRKRPREKHGAPILAQRSEGGDRRRVRVRRKRRRRHPDNLPRNPTLGETGGLPPIRSEDEPLAREHNPEPPQAKS